MTAEGIAEALAARLETVRAETGLPIERLDVQAWDLDGRKSSYWTVTGGGSYATMLPTEAEAIAELAGKLRVNPREQAADKRAQAAQLLADAAALDTIGGAT